MKKAMRDALSRRASLLFDGLAYLNRIGRVRSGQVTPSWIQDQAIARFTVSAIDSA
ncbi:hypothetical protein [Paraburkholderia sp.]|uniref:hypothetical protein n=1 Tax=Paraburkholderia sp. TaxID=1926495 RepID=UPI00286FA25E|nr:hypothetical protein [Paraburkholderia sp.]